MTNIKSYLDAGRATAIPTGESGLWSVRRIKYPFLQGPLFDLWDGFTLLTRWTNCSIMNEIPETVMSDDANELQKHLEPAMKAFGNVLVTGLGLGCVLRMLQHNPRVESITLIEISRDVVDLVWPHTAHDRVELIHDCALKYLRASSRKWDLAWHDVWRDESAGESRLNTFHQDLMVECLGRVKWQGAWAFPRVQRRAFHNMTAEFTADKIKSTWREWKEKNATESD